MKRVLLLLTIILTLGASYWFYARSVKSFHPALLTEDYNILTIADLNKSDEIAIRSKFDGTNRAYPYWQCFPRNEIQYSCDTSMPKTEIASTLEIKIENKNSTHVYLWPRVISGEVCEMKLAEIAKALKGMKHFCIKGQNFDIKRGAQMDEYTWDFFEVKTQTGSAYSFEPED